MAIGPYWANVASAGHLPRSLRRSSPRPEWVSPLARDLGVLAAQGWQAQEIAPIDMFPHTPHAEWVVHLTRPHATDEVSVEVAVAEAVPKKVTKPRKKAAAKV